MQTPHEKQVGGDHYKTLPIQPIDYIRKNNLGWFEGNIVKYITRHKQKGQIEDIKKVIHYAELILEEYDNGQQPDATGDSDTDSDRLLQVPEKQLGLFPELNGRPDYGTSVVGRRVYTG